jgi:DNA-binding NarL/FixJ family response regulator
MKTRILLADDHDVVRLGLRALLESSGMEVVGEAGEGREALRLAEELKPDVAILDVTMPGLNGIEAAAELRQRCPETHIVFVSMHSDAEHVHRAFAAGAAAYLLKARASDEIVAAVVAVRAGRHYLGGDLDVADQARAALSGARSPLDSLSARERQVLQLVVEGHTSAEVARLVHLSPKSVETYRRRLMTKLGVTDVTSLVKFAVRHGLTPGG